MLLTLGAFAQRLLPDCTGSASPIPRILCTFSRTEGFGLTDSSDGLFGSGNVEAYSNHQISLS
ncbi:MAG: hypothetical protein IPH20_23250 [Bacteroidales bacterium]|nr:hypothetical protein [Bacteroidales bacterium]